MTDDSLNDEIAQSAIRIGTPVDCPDLREAQLFYWLAVKNIMRTGGYSELRKRVPGISIELARLIHNATYTELRNLCSPFFASMCPSLPDETLQQMLKSTVDPALAALQMLAGDTISFPSAGVENGRR